MSAVELMGKGRQERSFGPLVFKAKLLLLRATIILPQTTIAGLTNFPPLSTLLFLDYESGE
jgi:hypothetical protein